MAATAAAEVTGTKTYVNLAMPESAERVAAQDVDGVGLLRAEFMLTERWVLQTFFTAGHGASRGTKSAGTPAVRSSCSDDPSFAEGCCRGRRLRR